jgi:hypothetical protein
MGGELQTWTLDNFGAGEDLREGVFSNQQNRFLKLENFHTTSAKRLVRRPPVLQVADNFSPDSQGLIELNGLLYSIAKKGTTPPVPTGVQLVYFDNPDHCTDWFLVDVVIFNSKIVAAIRHTFPGGTIENRIFLHVFDGSTKKPTYVEDAFCPTSWAPRLPLNLYNSGTLGAFNDYNPSLWVIGNRVWMSGPDGNVYFSRVANARAWNTRTVDEILEGGEWWYFLKPTGTGIKNFIVSEIHADLEPAYKWSAYILEYWNTYYNAWIPIVEASSGPGSNGSYFPASVASRFGGVNEIELRVWQDSAYTGPIYRFRLIAGDPPYKIVSGRSIKANTSAIRTGNAAATVYTIQEILLPPPAHILSGGASNVILVHLNSALQATPANYSISYNSSDQLVVTFVVAPGAGVTIQVVRDSVVYDAGTTEFGGAQTVEAHSVSNPGQIASKVFLRGHNVLLDVTATPSLAPFGVSGYTRYYGRLISVLTTNSIKLATSDIPYVYAHQSLNGFFSEKKLDYQLNQAGAGDAGSLPTASSRVASGQVTMMTGVKNRLMVSYSTGSQLWEVASDPLQMRELDVSPLGTGSQTTPKGVYFEGILMVPLASGLWGISLGSDLSDRMQTNEIGDPIAPGGIPILQDAVYWPWLGCYVAAQSIDGDSFLRVFEYNRENKVAAWERWRSDVIDTTEPNSMVALNDRLYIRQGNNLYYFDASIYTQVSPAFIDVGETVGNAYLSTAEWHRNELKKPGTNKMFLYFDMASKGTWQPRYRVLAYDDNQVIDGPVISGVTYGRNRVGLSMTTQSVGLILETRTESGADLERVAFDFRYMKR